MEKLKFNYGAQEHSTPYRTGRDITFCDDTSRLYIGDKLVGESVNKISIGSETAVGAPIPSIVGGTKDNSSLTGLLGTNGSGNNYTSLGEWITHSSTSQGKNSISFGSTNEVDTDGGNAVGFMNVVSCKGYYYCNLDTATRTFTLSTERGSEVWSDETLDAFNWQVGDTISFVKDSKYPACCKIESISGHNVTVDALPKVVKSVNYTNNNYICADDFTIFACYQRYEGAITTTDNNGDTVISDYGLRRWYPRSGEIDIGWINSSCFGTANLASGGHSFVTGWNNWAAGEYSHVSGCNNVGGYVSLVGGKGNYANSGSFVAGLSNDCKASVSCAIGYDNHVESNSTSTYDGFQTALGYKNINACNHSTTIGTSNEVSDGTYETAIGQSNSVKSSYSMALGRANKILTSNSSAIGYNNQIDEAVAEGATISATNQIAIGFNNKNWASNSIFVGISNSVEQFDVVRTNTHVVVGLNNVIQSGNAINQCFTLGSTNKFSSPAAFYHSTKIDTAGNPVVLTSGNCAASVGILNNTKHMRTYLFGEGLTTTSDRQVVIGCYNDTTKTLNPVDDTYSKNKRGEIVFGVGTSDTNCKTAAIFNNQTADFSVPVHVNGKRVLTTTDLSSTLSATKFSLLATKIIDVRVIPSDDAEYGWLHYGVDGIATGYKFTPLDSDNDYFDVQFNTYIKEHEFSVVNGSIPPSKKTYSAAYTQISVVALNGNAVEGKLTVYYIPYTQGWASDNS